MSLNETYNDFNVEPRRMGADRPLRNRLNKPETATMATMAGDKMRASRKPVAKDTMEYRLIFAACFPVFLVATIAERLTAVKRLSVSDAEPAKSFLGEAIEATHRCTSLAFMG
jgi:hypothetical protein